MIAGLRDRKEHFEIIKLLKDHINEMESKFNKEEEAMQGSLKKDIKK